MLDTSLSPCTESSLALDENELCQLARQVIDIETESVKNLSSRIDQAFVQACQLMLQCTGRVIVIGMGKSGHIGNKIAATLASTGTPAFFVHPGEASHGDLGMITRQDVVLALSNSGETSEILTILPLINHHHVPLITLTGNPRSTLARRAQVNLDISVNQEACPLGLAPTSSTTVSLVMGDALAVVLLKARGFTKEDFARSHPAGSLGRQLLLCVEDIMRPIEATPRVSPQTPITEALMEITQKGMGMTCIVAEDGKLLGIFTDGDLRRALDQQLDLHQCPIEQAMTANCKTVGPATLASQALKLMENYKISVLVAVDEAFHPVGALHMHDLLQAGIL